MGYWSADNFYNGTRWEVGLKQILSRTGYRRAIYPDHTDAPPLETRSETSAAMAYVPDAPETGIAVIRAIEAVPEYKAILTLSTD